MVSKIKNQKAAILILAIMFIFLLSLLSLAIFIYLYNQTSLNYKEINRIKAFYACEAAMNYALQEARLGRDPTNSNYKVFDSDNRLVAEVDIAAEIQNPPQQYPDCNAVINCTTSY